MRLQSSDLVQDKLLAIVVIFALSKKAAFEEELPTLAEYLKLFSRVRVALWCVYFVISAFFGFCIVCPSRIYSF